MPPPNDKPEPDAGEPREEEGQDGIDHVLADGLRKLYDPILEEQVPAEMLEILRRMRTRS